MPVLPDVPSTITPPGRSSPEASASRTIASAARSFTLPPGLRNSALRWTSAAMPSVTRVSRMRGVSPMASSTLTLLESGADRGDARGVEAEPVHAADVPGVLDLEAAVHDHGQA